MQTIVPILVKLEDKEWESLRDSLRSTGNHLIWNKIVEQYIAKDSKVCPGEDQQNTKRNIAKN